jgi:hypothetical protein
LTLAEAERSLIWGSGPVAQSLYTQPRQRPMSPSAPTGHSFIGQGVAGPRSQSRALIRHLKMTTTAQCTIRSPKVLFAPWLSYFSIMSTPPRSGIRCMLIDPFRITQCAHEMILPSALGAAKQCFLGECECPRLSRLAQIPFPSRHLYRRRRRTACETIASTGVT